VPQLGAETAASRQSAGPDLESPVAVGNPARPNPRSGPDGNQPGQPDRGFARHSRQDHDSNRGQERPGQCQGENKDRSSRHQTDPRISFTFKDGGDYIVEIKDVLNRGGADYFYRLRIGDFPLATTPVPMAAKRGTKAKISFAGPAVEDAAPVDVDVPTDPTLT